MVQKNDIYCRCIGFAATLVLCLGLAMPAFSDAPSPPAAPPANSDSSESPASKASGLTNPCANEGADLTGDFATDPCSLTNQNRELKDTVDKTKNPPDQPYVFDPKYFGGQQVVEYLNSWWLNDFLPALKDMTAQLHASRIDQTRQIGSMLDSQNVTVGAGTMQKQELEAWKNNNPSELTCVAASPLSALAQSSSLSRALTQEFKKDLGRRTANAVGTSAETGPGAEQKVRWEEYCLEFHDPDGNNGVSACPNPATPGKVVNGDIDVEGFLLKDTIDMSNNDQYRASLSLLKNLVEPKVRQKIPDTAVHSATGEEWILRQQHLDSVRNIASDVIASIISRRTGLPPAAGPGGGEGTSKPIGDIIREIRLKAGVLPCTPAAGAAAPSAKDSPAPAYNCIADNPSYNEIMLALTKERFFDPEYFIRMHDDLGAIKQEQTAVNAYISLQYQDIYKLQEQINALLAARAALKLNADVKSSRSQSAPFQ